MKPLPFPYALNIGTDIVHLPRILRLITRPAKPNSISSVQQQNFHRFVRRILCEQEQEDFQRRFGLQKHAGQSPPTAVTTEMARWLAGRFAAKEAARKAAPGGAASIGWKDVCVRTEKEGAGGRPEVVYQGLDNRVAKLSISHDGEYVVATVLAAG